VETKDQRRLPRLKQLRQGRVKTRRSSATQTGTAEKTRDSAVDVGPEVEASGRTVSQSLLGELPSR
jgi:hypothetical protein